MVRLLPPPLPCAVVLAVIIAVSGRQPPTVPEGASPDDRAIDRVTGTVGGPVLDTRRGQGALLHARGTTVWVWSDGRLIPGQEVAITGRLRTPRGYLAPGSPDLAIVAASRGAEWEIDATSIDVLGDRPGWMARTWREADAMQHVLASRIDADTGAGAALRGIVTGDRSRIPASLDERWRIVGIYHVLSVSGLHLAVIAGLAFALLRRLIAASPWGGRTRPARWAAPIALLLAIAYTLVTGAQLATLRALVVVAIVLVGHMLDRPVRLLDALGVAAIVILVWRPQDLHDASFQLSFTAALTLALRPPAPVVLGRSQVMQWIRRGLATSAWVAITTAPITALHFHQVAAGGIVGNLILTPVVELLALPLGLAGAVLGDVGAPLVTLGVWLVALVDGVARVLAAGIPSGAIAISSPLVMAALLVLSLWLSSRRMKARGTLAAWIALCVAWGFARTPPPRAALRVTFLDVGQGDAALIELPDGDVWLVDAGGNASARDLAAASTPGRTIERALAVYGHQAIDLAIISHPHPDHYLGLAGLGMPIRELWIVDDAPATHHRMSFAAIALQLVARGTRITRPVLGDLQRADGVELLVLAPRYRPAAGAVEILAGDPVRTVNDNSLVIAVRYAGRTILFAGDLEAEGEEELVSAGLPQVDVVKVAHHGSRTSSSDAFVDATAPELAVISCGVANAFGFPAPEVEARWRDAGAAIARTDTDGAITVTVDAGGGLTVDRFAPRDP